MSTRTDNVQNNSAIDLGEGVIATPNGDGTYTITGAPDGMNGVWQEVEAGTPDAFQMENSGTQFDGRYFVKL